ELTFERGADGLSAHGKLRLAEADVAELLPGDGRPPLSGRLTYDVEFAGTGRSPVALIGSLQGGGTFTLQDGRIMRLDPAAFEAGLAWQGPELAGAPEGTRPERGIVLKGPIEAPRRTLDVTAFASWLALRAVEQQAKRLEAIEQQAKRAEAIEPTVSEPPVNAP